LNRSRVLKTIVRSAWLWALVGAGSVAPGCAKRAPQGTMAPSAASADAAGMAYEEDEAAAAEGGEPSFQELQSQLTELEDALHDAGVSVVGSPAHGATPATEDAGQCTRVCDLKEAICELEDHLCRLATDHADEARYTDACGRAQTDCGWAQEACDGCTSA